MGTSCLLRVSRALMRAGHRKRTNVSTGDGGVGRLETKAHVLVPPLSTGVLASHLRVQEKGLLLEGLFRLHTKLHVRHCD